MAENIVGPFGPGINETTTRPADPAPGSSIDTWFAPCINGDPSTGTRVPAVWLNKVTALLRRAIRGMGVPDKATDDDMLLKAIQRADVPLRSVGLGISVYDGKADGHYNIRSLVPGANISITPVEAPDNAGTQLVISAQVPPSSGENPNQPILVLRGDGFPNPAVYVQGEFIRSFATDFRSQDGPTWDPVLGFVVIPQNGIWRISGTLHADDYAASWDHNVAEVAIFVNEVCRLRFAPHFVGWGQSLGCSFAFDGVVAAVQGDLITFRVWADSLRHFREPDFSQIVVQRVRDLV